MRREGELYNRRQALLAATWPRVLGGATLLGAAALIGLFSVLKSDMLALGPAIVPESLVLLGGGAAAALLVLGPSWLMIGLFILALITGNESLPFFTINRFGVEWHPREILLLLGAAHGCVLFLKGRIDARDGPVHYCMALYAAFFLVAALVGVAYGRSTAIIIGEARFALFLLTYPILVAAIASRRAALRYAAFAGLIVFAVALLGLLFFVYAMGSGRLLSEYNSLGAFIRRDVGGVLVQTVRPNGVMLFETAVVILVSLLLGGGLSRAWRRAVLAALALFAAAILITGMRTAYVSTAASLLLLGFLHLPPRTRRGVIALGLGVGVIAGAALWLLLSLRGLPALNMVEVSLRARLVETLGGWELFAEHPLFGGGMGATFEALGLVGQKAHMSYAPTQYATVHNFFLYVLFKGGLVGVILTVAGLTGLAWCGMKTADNATSPFDRAFVRGLTAALAGQCLASIAMTRLYYPLGHVFIAFAALVFHVLGNKDAAPVRRD